MTILNIFYDEIFFQKIGPIEISINMLGLQLDLVNHETTYMRLVSEIDNYQPDLICLNPTFNCDSINEIISKVKSDNIIPQPTKKQKIQGETCNKIVDIIMEKGPKDMVVIKSPNLSKGVIKLAVGVLNAKLHGVEEPKIIIIAPDSERTMFQDLFRPHEVKFASNYIKSLQYFEEPPSKRNHLVLVLGNLSDYSEGHKEDHKIKNIKKNLNADWVLCLLDDLKYEDSSIPPIFKRILEATIFNISGCFRG